MLPTYLRQQLLEGIFFPQKLGAILELKLVGICFYYEVAYFLLLQKAYAVGDVSVVYPLARGTGPLLSVVLAVALLGERPGIPALIGAVVVVAGVMTIGFAGGRSTAKDNRAGVLLGLLIGVLIACYTLWDATAVTLGNLPVVGLYWGSVLFQSVLLAPAAASTDMFRDYLTLND